jgi:hypothetical protein
MTEIPAGFHGQALRLTAADVDRAAAALGIEARTVWAVAQVEADQRGFLPDGRPELLFEAERFHQLTGGKWDQSHPNISSPVWDKSLYGAAGAHQYDRLGEAIELEPYDPALKSATWGMFQVLGDNHAAAGFADVGGFVAAMCESEGRQLDAFAAFCRAKGLVSALANHDWLNFALGYNGAGEMRNAYAAKLMVAYMSGHFPPDAPQPPPARAQKAITLQRGEEATFPLTGLDQNDEPLPLAPDALTSLDPSICTAAIADGVAAIVYVGPGQTAVLGPGLELDITCEAPRLARLVPDWSRLTIKRISAASMAAALALGMFAQPAEGPKSDSQILSVAVTDDFRPLPTIGSPAFCFGADQPVFAIERCLRWTSALLRR